MIALACTIWRPGFGDSDAYIPPIYAVNEATVDDDIIDPRVYSETLGLNMFDIINKMRKEGDLPVRALNWNSNWNNLLFKVATDYSKAVFDLPQAPYLSERYAEMDESGAYLDHEIKVFKFPELDSSVYNALPTINGGGKSETITDVSIAVYKAGDGNVYFAQAIARKIANGKFSTALEKSTAWGQKGTDLVNMYRGAAKLVWSDTLHSLCFDHSNAMAKGTQPIALYNEADLLTQIKLKVAVTATAVAENIAVSIVTPISNTNNVDAVNDAFK